MISPIHYSISARDCAAHVFDVTVTLDTPAADGQIFSLPAWIPGSYMIREFARNIIQLHGEAGGKPLALRKLDKHTWRAAPCTGPLKLHYQVYAWDLSVRTAHLDQTHGFFNGSSVFLRVEGQEQSTHIVDIRRPPDPHCKRWRVATSLPELKAKRYGFGSYIASNYDELIDHPVELGNFALATFTAHGVPHDIVVTGQVPNLDLTRLGTDLKKICEAQIAFFAPRSKRAPMARYVFMTTVVGDGYGGLEHRASTALICARRDLPVTGKSETTEGYRRYLGLCSHEYFHTWNVKRIKPAVFAPYDLQQEGYTSLLWLFEGFTSYYDDLFLVRAGLIDASAYLNLLANTINSVLRGNGRHKQSVAESSFDAWIKYYRQDENAPNAIVSYYTKGALVALGLDLTIRHETKGKKSLDDIMLALWRQYGRGQGITEDEVEPLFEEISTIRLQRFFDRYIRGTEDLPLAQLMAGFGVTYTDTHQNAKLGMGIRVVDGKVANVYEGGTGQRAGLSAGDYLVALDGLRIPATGMENLLARYRDNDIVELHLFRRDELMHFKVQLKPDDAPQVTLSLTAKPALAHKRKPWLGR